MIANVFTFLFLALALGLGYHNHKFIKDRIIAQGRVTDLPSTRGSKGSTTYKIVAVFMDRSENEHTYRSSFSYSSPGYRIGDPIRICYLESNPNSCGIYSFGYRFGAVTMLAAVALALWVMWVGFKYGQPIMDSIYQPPPLQQ